MHPSNTVMHPSNTVMYSSNTVMYPSNTVMHTFQNVNRREWPLLNTCFALLKLGDDVWCR